MIGAVSIKQQSRTHVTGERDYCDVTHRLRSHQIHVWLILFHSILRPSVATACLPALATVGRYAMEHWLGSHPDFWPCEVFSKLDGNVQMGYLNHRLLNVTMLVPRLRQAPPVAHYLDDYRPDTPFIDLYHLKGRLWMYQELYGTVPDVNTSWIYGYLKDEEPILT